jgi:hypothetical protein
MAAPSFEEMEKTVSNDIPKMPSFEEMEKTHIEAAPAPQPGLHASVQKNVKEPARTPDWLNFLHGVPVVGDVTRGAEQVINNAGQATQEFQKDPVSSGMAAVGGAASGATGAVEAPLALAGNVIPNLLIPQGMRTQRQFPGQTAGTPEEQASKVLQQATAQQPPQYSYGQMVGGNPMSDRIQQATQRAFPNEPGSAATGQVAGGLAVPMKGLGIAGKVGQPLVNRLARGAAEGAAIGEGYHLGEQAAHGQPLQAAAAPALGGALVGAGIHAATGVKPKEPTKVSEIKSSKPKAEKKVVGQVIKKEAAPSTFNNAQEALDAWYDSKDPVKQQAAKEYLEKGKSEPAQRPVEENVPQEEETQTNPQLDAIYEKIGKKPVETEAVEEEEPVNDWQQRENVPREIAESQHQIMDRNTQVGMRDEKGNYIHPGGKTPFDWTNSEPRRGWVIDPRTGEHTRQMIIPSAFDEASNVTHVDLGRKLGKGGAAKEAAALASISKQTHVQGQRRAEGYTEEQQHALDNTIAAIENNDIPAAQAAAMMKPISKYKKLSEVKKPEGGTALYSDPFMIGPMISLAKQSGEPLGAIAKRFLGEDWKETMGHIVKMQDTFDRIEEGSNNAGDDIHTRLWHNLAGEALDTRGLKLEGQFAEEARQALKHLTPDEILEEKNTPDWTPEQREAVATKKVYRMDTKQLIKDTLKNHGEDIDPEFERALKDYSANQYGYRGQYKNGFEKGLDSLTGHLYQGFFRWNPAFHALVATHPLQMGTAVTGVRNIANAYRLRFTDPEIKDFMGSLSSATEDLRSVAAEERFQRQTETDAISKPRSKFMEKDIPTGRLNNEVIALSGMLKKGHELYGEGQGEQAVRDLANGSMPKEQQLEMMTAGLQAMRDATSGGTFGINRTQLQDSQYLRTFAQLSGYKHIVARYASKLGQQINTGIKTENPAMVSTATKSLGTLLGATILLGGHAVIPKETEEGLYKILGPQRMYGIEKALDALNLPAKAGINLQDHMQYSLANWGVNVALNAFPEIARSMDKLFKDDGQPFHEKLADFVGKTLLLSDLAPLGVGMSTWNKGRQGLHDAKEGEKKISVYSTSPMPTSIYPIGKGKMTYTAGDLLYSLFAPGVESRIQNFRQKKRVTALFKKYAPGEDLPKTLEEDYPSPGIESTAYQ